MSKGRQGSRRFRKTGVVLKKNIRGFRFKSTYSISLCVSCVLFNRENPTDQFIKDFFIMLLMKIISQMFKHTFFLFEEMQQAKAKTTLNRYIVKHFHEENRLTCC